MPDWDEDSAQLRSNLTVLLRHLRDRSRSRQPLQADDLRAWHGRMMQGLELPDPRWVGVFRGEPGAETVEVRFGLLPGTAAREVKAAAKRFFEILSALLAQLDAEIPSNKDPLSADQLEAILEACAWAHSEWVRIHPFTNGNGRTARLLANYLAMRYGLPPFVRLRPRPEGSYAQAAAKAMAGEWRPAISVFRKQLVEALGSS